MNIFISRNGAVALSMPRIFSKRFLASAAKQKDDIDITSLEEQPIFSDDIVGLSKKEIDRKRNKSRLLHADRNVLHDQVPQHTISLRYHNTVRYKRRMFGRYGMEACNVPIGVVWPTKAEIEDAKEYESVLYPDTIQQMWEKIATQKINDAKTIRERDEAVAKNYAKLNGWVAELKAKMAKKEEEARVARERKERLIEEVRRHFGFKISSKDERFKEMLAQKDKADKKLKKQAKKQAKQQQMLTMFAEKAQSLPKKEQSDNIESSDNVQ